MNISPKRVFVEKGNYKPSSITLCLTGNEIVDTSWALNILSVRFPLNCNVNVIATSKYSNDLFNDWKNNPIEYTTNCFIDWPAGTHLKWNAITEAIKEDTRFDIAIGNAVIRRRGTKMLKIRDDLLATEEHSGHPEELVKTDENLLDTKVNPDLTIVIGIPSLGKTSLLWAKSLAELSMPIGTVYYLVYLEGYEVGDSRQRIVEKVMALKPRPAYLLFIGDDNLVPFDSIRKLYDNMQQYPNVAAMGGLYNTKTTPKQVCAWNCQRTLREGEDYKDGEVVEVESMGLDCCLIRTSLLEKLSTPMFQTVQEVEKQATEDSYFWAKVKKETGCRPFLDTSIKVGHYNMRDGKVY